MLEAECEINKALQTGGEINNFVRLKNPSTP